MRILILSILCIVVVEVSSKKALLFNLETRSLVDPCRKNGDQKCPPYLTACPAFMSQERQFNMNMSIGKRSLFSRFIYAKDEFAKNIETDICENRIKPTMLYDTEDKDYEIGYELYFEDGKIKMTDKTYHRYKPVNTTNPNNYKILNVSIPKSDGLVTRYENENHMKFNFTNGNRTLVFYWIEVLSIKSSKYKKRAKWIYYDDLPDSGSTLEHLQDKCSNYRSDDDELYSEENQKKSLSGISVPSSLYKGNPDMECGQPYGCLEKSQIIPLWYFSSRSARLASCSHMNLIPVWKSIVEQLRKVDLYILAIIETLTIDNIIFGVSGPLKMNTSTNRNSVASKVYLSNTKRRRKMPIPKIIYRIVTLQHCCSCNRCWHDSDESCNDYCHPDCDYFRAAIIIHNDPSVVPRVEKLCDEDDILTGWDEITNNDTRNGLTYVCPVTEKLYDKLGAYDNLTLDDEIPSLKPDSVPYCPYWESHDEGCIFTDYTHDVDKNFKKLLNNHL